MPLTFAPAMLQRFPWEGCRRSSGFWPRKRSMRRLPGAIHGRLPSRWRRYREWTDVCARLCVALKPFVGAQRDFDGRASSGRRRSGQRHAPHIHEAPLLMLAGPIVLALAGLASGVWSQAFHAAFSSPMASAIAHEPRRRDDLGDAASLPALLSVAGDDCAGRPCLCLPRPGPCCSSDRARIDRLGAGPGLRPGHARADQGRALHHDTHPDRAAGNLYHGRLHRDCRLSPSAHGDLRRMAGRSPLAFGSRLP